MRASLLASVFAVLPLSAAYGCGGSGGAGGSGATSTATGTTASATSSGAATGAGGSTSSASSSESSSASSSASASASSSASSSASASSSTSASASSSTGSGGSSPGGVGDPCNAGGDCSQSIPNTTLYCDKSGCGAGPGKCAVQPKNTVLLSQTSDPVCGCDGLTYWNADWAAFHAASTQVAPGPCPAASAVACSDIMACPGTSKCNRKVPDQATCAPPPQGACWSMPISCAAGPSAKACTNQACQTVCDLIESQNPWFDDGACP
jgi:hypothetical protein